MSQLRIFSYLPNPRVWKATIAARICGVEIEVRGAPPAALSEWLWDFDARPIDQVDVATAEAARRIGRIGFKDRPLYKTDAFLVANPFGTVPVAFSDDGSVGIFESNSIMRAVARLSRKTGQLYGVDAYEAARIDSFLDVSLVFGRDAQIYLLALHGTSVSDEIYHRASEAFATYLGGIETALPAPAQMLVGDRISLADICFACELALFHNEIPRFRDHRFGERTPILDGARARYPLAFAHFDRLIARPDFEELGPYMAKLAA